MKVIDLLIDSIWEVIRWVEWHSNHLITKIRPDINWLFLDEVPVISFYEAAILLKQDGVFQNLNEDLSTENEKRLGDIMLQSHGADMFVVHSYPTKVRPFYTMAHPDSPNFTWSYDFFLRGEEILSGAQWEHNIETLEKQIISWGIKPENLEFYLEPFRYGMMPHAGAGIGLDWVLKLILNKSNIRDVVMFPWDPKWLSP